VDDEIHQARLRLSFTRHSKAFYRGHYVTRMRRRVYHRGENPEYLYYVDNRPTPFDHIDLALDEIDYLIGKESVS
jgi:hypothetical protein